MQCACAILPSVSCRLLQYISTLPHKRQDSKKSDLTQNVCFDFPSNLYLKISYRKETWVKHHEYTQTHTHTHNIYIYIYIYIYRSSCTFSFSCKILISLEVSRMITKNSPKPNFMTIRILWYWQASTYAPGYRQAFLFIDRSVAVVSLTMGSWAPFYPPPAETLLADTRSVLCCPEDGSWVVVVTQWQLTAVYWH